MRTRPPRLLVGFAGTIVALLGAVMVLRLTNHPWLLPSLGGLRHPVRHAARG